MIDCSKADNRWVAMTSQDGSVGAARI